MKSFLFCLENDPWSFRPPIHQSFIHGWGIFCTPLSPQISSILLVSHPIPIQFFQLPFLIKPRCMWTVIPFPFSKHQSSMYQLSFSFLSFRSVFFPYRAAPYGVVYVSGVILCGISLRRVLCGLFGLGYGVV